MSDNRESKEKVTVEKAIEILSSFTNNYFGDKLHGGQVGVVDIIDLLKEQEPIKPVRDPKCERIWLCGNCGRYVGFEDSDPDEKNEFYNFCHQCGKAVRWNDSD